VRAALARPFAQASTAAVACALLLSRPWLWALAPHPAVITAFFLGLGAVGVAWPSFDPSTRRPQSILVPILVAAGGMMAFGLARLLEGGQAPIDGLAGSASLAVLAAVAEEAFFRRFLYQFLAAGGVWLAVVGSAICFALVHVGIYGPSVLPLDLAAGLLLSWQRWASGTWVAPAATHVFANLVALY
jgi:membrane protease YdiL (CAAX protease family)